MHIGGGRDGLGQSGCVGVMGFIINEDGIGFHGSKLRFSIVVVLCY